MRIFTWNADKDKQVVVLGLLKEHVAPQCLQLFVRGGRRRIRMTDAKLDAVLSEEGFKPRSSAEDTPL
jgi:hypothetical protein